MTERTNAVTKEQIEDLLSAARWCVEHSGTQPTWDDDSIRALILAAPAPPTSTEREDAIQTIDNLLLDADWHSPGALRMVEKVKALILASPVSPKVSRAEIREWAKEMTNAADHYKSLTSDQFIILCEANENYLTARLQEKGIEVEP